MNEVLGNEKVIFQSSKNQSINQSIYQSINDYWKVLVLNFSGIGNAVFSWDKKLMKKWYLLITEKSLIWTFRGMGNKVWDKKSLKRWYLLITKKFLFWTFRWWEMRSFLRQKVNEKMIFSDYRKVLLLSYRKILVLNFSVLGNKVFILAKKLI